MKKIVTLLLCTFVAASVFAGDITVAFTGNRPYQVLIDGRNISNYNSWGTAIRLPNIQPGIHSIAVYRMRNNKGWNNNNSPVYAANFSVRPQQDLFITIANNGRIEMREKRSRYDDNDRSGGYGNDDHRRDRNYDNDNDRNYHDNDYGYRERNNNGYGNGGYGNDNNWGNKTYNNAMSDNNFRQLVQRVRSQFFGKFNTAKEAVSNNYFNTWQVKQLLQLFSSDRERLELAEQAYRNTVDPRN